MAKTICQISYIKRIEAKKTKTDGKALHNLMNNAAYG